MGVIPSSSHVSDSDQAQVSAECLRVLERMCKGAGVEFQPVLAVQALRNAEREIPPTVNRAARRRLVQSAEALGLQIITRQMSVSEAIAAVDQSPLAIFSVGGDGRARWHVLTEASGGRGCAARLNSQDQEEFLSIKQWAQRIGVSDGETLVEWMLAQPAAYNPLPLEDAEHETHDHPHGVPPLRRLFSLLQPDLRDVAIVILYAVGIGILSLATPITALAVVNTTAMATLVQQLLVLCLALFVSLGLAAFLRGLQAVVVECLQQRVFVRVVADLAYRLPRVDVQAFDRQHGPELVNRFFDVLTVQKAGATLLLDGVTVVLQILIGLGLLAAYHHLLLGFDLFLIAALFVIVFVLGRGAVQSSIRESRSKYRVASWLEEMARNPSSFKSSGAVQFAFEQADLLSRQYVHYRQSHFRILLRQFASALALQALASALLLGLGGYLVIQGRLSLGQLVAAEIVVSLAVASFTKLGKQLESYYDLLAAADKLGHLTDLPLERGDGVAFDPGKAGLRIETRNLHYQYHHGHRDVLSDLSIAISSGESVAVVGPNGSGKSTLCDLLTGQRQPTRGYVEINSQDLRDLRLESYRQHIAIAKGIEIFDGAVLDNVRMGREDLTIADIRTALESVGLLQEILNLPAGLKTRLSPGGAPLSLGQSERLMLARAIAGHPRLIIIDELLDDMDQQVRDEVLPNILRNPKRWTLLVITHSDDVARRCDRAIRLSRNPEASQNGH